MHAPRTPAVVSPSRRAPRRPRVPSDERRVQVLRVAAELFARHGFAGTTTRQIAAAAGTTETVLFRLFPTKEALYLDVLEYEVPAIGVERFLDRLRALAAARDDEALCRLVVDAILLSFRQQPVYHRLMLFAVLEHQDLARAWQVRYMAPVAGFLTDYVAHRQAEGAMTGVRPALVVHTLIGTASHYGLWNLLGVNTFGLSDDEVADHATATLRGLRKKRQARATTARTRHSRRHPKKERP